jgi:hypothetical protein
MPKISSGAKGKKCPRGLQLKYCDSYKKCRINRCKLCKIKHIATVFFKGRNGSVAKRQFSCSERKGENQKYQTSI